MDIRPIRWLAPALAVLLITACGSMAAKRTPREEALYTYVSAIRWSDFEAAANFVDPMVLAENPITDLEKERFKQFQVSGYLVKGSSEPSEDRYEQVVEIRLVNRNTQVERIITDRQQWRWDAEAKRWWLMSGLPDLEPR
ncbi:hypothetical protein [Arenimonas sp. MALMAid1274]|uniref:hypothetical protein n=1 Tax=Arenimonas sp. MALMAid1274 TaxID=3411630 RepID=UPI003BA0093D